MSGRRGRVRSTMGVGHADGYPVRGGDVTCRWQRKAALRRRIGPKTVGGCGGAVRVGSLRVVHELIVPVVVAAANGNIYFREWLPKGRYPIT